MDDLTKIKGVGKATAEKLAAAGFDDFAKLALANTSAGLQKLQEAGFAPTDIEKWAEGAKAALLASASLGDQGNQDGDAGAGGADPDKPVSPGLLIATQEVRHLGVTYGPGEPLPDTVEAEEAEHLKGIGAAEET